MTLQTYLFDILQERLLSHPFLMSRKFETQYCQWYGFNGLYLFLRISGKIEQGLGHLLITSSGSYFANKPISNSISLKMYLKEDYRQNQSEYFKTRLALISCFLAQPFQRYAASNTMYVPLMLQFLLAALTLIVVASIATPSQF